MCIDEWGSSPIGAGGGFAHDAPMASVSRSLPRELRRLQHRRRPSLRVRLRTALKAPELDDELANGADPLASPELTLKASQLVRPGKRAELAQALELVVKQVACGGPSPVPGPTLLRRQPVARNLSELRALARRLRADDLQCLPGLAMADRLIRYGDSPLYMAFGPLQLKHRIEEILAALDPDWDGLPADMPRWDSRWPM
jgi:hypothetical protein